MHRDGTETECIGTTPWARACRFPARCHQRPPWARTLALARCLENQIARAAYEDEDLLDQGVRAPTLGGVHPWGSPGVESSTAQNGTTWYLLIGLEKHKMLPVFPGSRASGSYKANSAVQLTGADAVIFLPSAQTARPCNSNSRERREQGERRDRD